MKRALLVAVTFIGIVAHHTRSEAVIVECSNCSSIFEQLVSGAREAKALATQLQQYQTQLRQYANMVQNTINLPQAVWSNVMGDVSQVRNLANRASLLAGRSGGIIQNLNQAGGYAGQVANMPTTIANQFTTWQTTFGNSARNLGLTIELQNQQQKEYAMLQEQAQGHSENAAGQMQAIQAGNQIAALTTTQLNQMQATLAEQAKMIATKYEIDHERQALADEVTNQAFTYTPYQTTGSPTFTPGSFQ